MDRRLGWRGETPILISGDAWHRLEREPRERWQQEFLASCEAQGPLPDWMPDWLKFWRTKPGVAGHTAGDQSDWRLSVTDMQFVQSSLIHGTVSGEIPDDQRAMLEKVAAFVDRIHTEFQALRPHPATLKRSGDWREWPDDDPLKRYYRAAAMALEDLATPVRVRDSAINAHGVVSDDDPLSRRTVKEPASAGYGVGYYINRHPAAAMDLLAHARKVGRGSVATGASKLIAGAEA